MSGGSPTLVPEYLALHTVALHHEHYPSNRLRVSKLCLIGVIYARVFPHRSFVGCVCHRPLAGFLYFGGLLCCGLSGRLVILIMGVKGLTKVSMWNRISINDKGSEHDRVTEVSVFGLPDWFSQAPCKAEPDLFFSSKPSEQRKAVAICDSCELRESCDDWLTECPQEYGVWAGKTPAEIRRLFA